MRVLLVEDHLSIAHIVSFILAQECKAVVVTVDNGEEAVELVRHYDYDAIILDLTLSDMHGFDVLRQVRAAGRHMPILVLSGLSGPEVKVRALRIGADDVMSKPFDKDELCARLKAIIRRSKGHSQSSLQVGPMTLNLDTHEVSISGKPIHLTGKEYAILALLALRRGNVLSKEQFLNHLYGGMDEPDAKIIDVFVCKLRKKLGEAGAPKLIATVWGRGYTIRAAASAMTSPPTATPAARPLAAAAGAADDVYAGERELISA